MKLFYHPASLNARATLVTAELADVSVERIELDVAKGEHRTTEYLQLNPNGLFPLLVDGDFILWETTAILQYLASTGRDRTLFPDEPRCRADICRWQCWALAHWAPALRPFIYENIFKRWKGHGDADPAVVAAACAPYERLARIIDKQVSEKSYLCGDTLTLADISVASHLMFAARACIPLGPFENMSRWYHRIAAVPAWRNMTSMPIAL